MYISDKQVLLCNAIIDNVSYGEAINMIINLVEIKKSSYVVTPNVDHVMRLQKDEEFVKIYKNAALHLCDGIPLLWAAKWLGMSLKEKISGSDLFPGLCRVAYKEGYRIFFLGGKIGAVSESRKILEIRYPGIQICGAYCPPIGFENDIDENNKIVEMIKAVKPDILFVGVGSPKQEKWIYRHKEELQVPVSIGIGATFDFVSGMVKRAPIWMQKSGLEWFWRLMMEPKRLWKRYLIDDPVFFWLVLKQKLGLLK